MDRARLANNEPTHAGSAVDAFRIGSIDPRVSDMRGSHCHELTSEGGIREYLLIACHSRGEDHLAGGLAVWAHPRPDVFDREIRRFAALGLDGVECFRPRCDGADSVRFERTAKNLGLVVTGGSDWHGPWHGKLGGFAVTAGHEVHGIAESFKQAGNDYDAIMVQSLADRLAEAFAEYMHARVRRELWGYAPDETVSGADLIDEKYRGIRPAPGYPACPDHTEKQALFDLLDAENHTGIRLTESFAMWPASSVSGLYFSHPASAYFGIGRIGRDQVEDYARRKNMPHSEIEKWLAPNLAYEPAREPEPESEPEAPLEFRRSA